MERFFIPWDAGSKSESAKETQNRLAQPPGVIQHDQMADSFDDLHFRPRNFLIQEFRVLDRRQAVFSPAGDQGRQADLLHLADDIKLITGHEIGITGQGSGLGPLPLSFGNDFRGSFFRKPQG